MSDSIKVAIKVRPLIKREKEENLPKQWIVKGNYIASTDQEMKKRGDGGFNFDHIFDESTSNKDVFDTVVKPIVDAAVNGFNGTVIAYGQTSSGKTYTMMGGLNEPGIILLAIEHMFDAIANTLRREFLLRVSYLEIYNEKVNDLLNKSATDLKLHEDNGQIVIKCKEEVTNSPEHVLSIMKKGNKNRRIGETDMNERSSRSHTIFRITIESRKTDAESDGAIQVSQLNLADFAGSERAGQTGTTGERFKEGRLINMSLSAFGLVIKQLSESQDTQKHVNFRDSKLTRLLQNSIGGNAKTAMICTITPAALEESHYTLSFASRAKKVENKPQINEVMSDATLLKRYAKQISKLNCELEKIKKETTEEMENRLHEKDRINQLLEERIELLQTKIVSGNNANIEDSSFGCRSKRRRTWAGPTFKQNVSTFQPCQGLPTIKEMSPVKPSRKSIIQTVNLMDQSFQIAFTDFELELINDEKDREDDDSIDSLKDVFITKDRHKHRVTFMDDMSIYKPNYDIYESTPIKKDTSYQTNDIEEDQSHTPKKVLRERITYLEQEFNKLCEFTTLEKQVYIEDHQCYSADEKEVKIEQNSDLQEQIINVTTENNLLKNIISEVLKYATSTTNISTESIQINLLDDTSHILNESTLDIPFKDIEVKHILTKLQNKITKSIKQHEIRNLEKIFELDIQMSHLKSENRELKEQIISLKEEMDEQIEKEKMYENEFEQNLSYKENPLSLTSDIKEESSVKKEFLSIGIGESIEFEKSLSKSKKIESILEQGKLLIEFSPIKPRKSLEQLNSNNKTCEMSPFLIKEILNDSSPKTAADVKFSVDMQRKKSILEEKENIIVEMNEEYKNVSIDEQTDNFDFENLLVKLHNHLDNIEKCEILKSRQLNEIFVPQDQELQYVISELNKQKIETDYNHITTFINESIHLKSLLHDLDTFINSIMTKNNKMKEHLEKQLIFLTESFNDNVDNEELVADLDEKTQELSEIKSDVVGLKLDMKKLQRTIFLLTAENEELSAKLNAEKISKADCLKMIDDLHEQNSKMKNENKDMLNEIRILNEQIKCFQSEEEDMKEDKCCLNYQDRINKSISNIELSNVDKEKHVNVDCKNTEQIDLVTDINEPIKNTERSMKDDTSFADYSSKNNIERNENSMEQLAFNNSLLKSEFMKLKEKVTLLTEENTIFLKKSLETLEGSVQDNTCNTFNDASKEAKDEKLDILFKKCTTLKETMDYLLELNTKLADLKIILCSRCVEMKELNENKKDIKLKTKMLTVKLENLQENFNRKCADIEVLKNKANEDSFLNISETSFDGSLLDGINVTSVEEEVSLLNKEMQILQDDHVKLSYLYKEKCNETERLRNAITTETNVVSPLKKDAKRGKSKIDKLQKDIDYCKIDLQELKNNIICDLKKSLNEISTLQSENDELSKIISNNNLLLEASEENAKLFENEITNIKANIEEKEAIINDLHRIIDECKEENDSLKSKLFSLENVEESIGVSQIYEDKYKTENMSSNENDKLKDDLNSAKACIINEMKCLKPIEDSQDYFDKSINSLLSMFLEMITSKEEEVINAIQEQFSINREKFENERQESINAEKCIRLRAEQLEMEIETLKNNITIQETKHYELLSEISRMEHSLKENNNEKEILMKQIQSLEMDYNNMQKEFNKQSEIKIQQKEMDINKKEEILTEKVVNEVELEIETIRIRKEYQEKIDNLVSTLEMYKIKNEELMKNLESFESNEKDLKNILNMRTDELTKSNKNSEKIRNDIEHLTNINNELNREMENKNASIAKLSTEIKDLVELVESYKRENMELIEKLERLKINETNLNVMLSKKMDEFVENNKYIEKMKTEAEHLAKTCNKLNYEIENKDARILEVTNLLQNKSDMLYEYKIKLESITPEYDVLKKQLEEEKLSIHRYKSELESLKVNSETHLENLKETLNIKITKYEELNKQFADLSSQNVILLTELNSLRKQYTELEEKNTKLEQKLRNSNNRIKLETDMEELLEQNKALQNNLDGAYNCIAELKDKKKHLLEEYLSTKERYESLLEENKKMIELLSDKETDLKYINHQCEELKGKNQELEEENKTLKKNNQDLDEEIEQVIRENDVLTEKVYSYFGDDNPKKLKAEINTLKEENQNLRDKITKCTRCGILQPKDQLQFNVESGISEENNNDKLVNLRRQIKELELELVSKNGRIAALQLQVQGESFPYQEKCKDLEENVLAFKNKNIQLESEIKKLRCAMIDINMKECYMCKNQHTNMKNQYVQTISSSKIQFCGTSSGIVEKHVQIEKLEKEKAFMKQLCRSRCKRIKELEKKLMEFQNTEDLPVKMSVDPEDMS